MNTAQRSLLFTLAAIATFWAVGRIPNPFLTQEAMSFLYGGRAPEGFSRASFGPFVLGIGPALSGFFLVEFFSYFLPPFSRWRKQNIAGRSKLNCASVVLTFLIAFATCYFVVRQMAPKPDGLSQFLDGSMSTLLGSAAFFIGGFALIYLGANLFTAWGLGNGFALFLLTGSLLRLADSLVRQYLPETGTRPPLWPLLLSGLILVGFAYFLSRRRTVPAEGPGGMSLSFEVPSVLQGLIAWSVAWQFAALLRSMASMRGWALDQSSDWARYFTFLLFFIPANVVLYWLSFSPKRMQQSTFGKLRLPVRSEKTVLEIAFLSFVVFATLELLAFIPHPLVLKHSLFSKALDLGSLILVYILGKDLWQNFKFLQKVPDPVLLGELDNIHLAALARSVAEADGQPVYLKGFEYRRLMSFFQPLVKIRLYATKDYAPVLREKIGMDTAPVV